LSVDGRIKDSPIYVTTGFQTDRLPAIDSDITMVLFDSGDIGDPTGCLVPWGEVSYNPLNLALEDNLNYPTQSVLLGDNVTYEITYDNLNNTIDVTNVVIQDILPPETDLVSVTGRGVYNPVNHSVTWNVGNLKAGEIGIPEQIVMNIDPATPLGTTIVNHANIISDQTTQAFVDHQTMVDELAPFKVWYVDCHCCGPVHNGQCLKTAFLSVQEAIDAALDGDLIRVNRGFYCDAGNYNLDFAGKAVTITSIKGAHNTWIDCYHRGPAFVFENGEGADSVVQGFTIYRAGNTEGAVVIRNSSPTISDNIIRETAYTVGGGIYIENGSPIITRNIINECEGFKAGGIFLKGSQATVTSNVLYRNITDEGGGLSIVNSVIDLTNNTIVENTVLLWGGGISLNDSTVTITNSIVRNNMAPFGPEVYIGHQPTPSSLDLSYSNVRGGMASVYVEQGSTLNWGSGIIDTDPLFVDAARGDYHIYRDSACRNTGVASAPSFPDMDFERDQRISFFAKPDMGADEFHTHFYISGKTSPGETVTANVVGWPFTNPVILLIGSGIRQEPKITPYGEQWISPPFVKIVTFQELPYNGIRRIDWTVNTALPPGREIPIQTMIGTILSNLWVILIQ